MESFEIRPGEVTVLGTVLYFYLSAHSA